MKHWLKSALTISLILGFDCIRYNRWTFPTYPDQSIVMAKVKQTKRKPDPLANRQATHFVFKSKLDRPIGEMSFLQRSLLFAETAMISYLSLEQCNIAAGKLGYLDGKFFSSSGAQAYWYETEHDSVVVCRGTEITEWDDIKADANAIAAVAETVGRVHRGFKSEVDEIWPHIEKELEANTKPLWFCGHSLGGAMATICAVRCMLSYIRSEPEEVYTYGSPRIGCNRYVNHVKLNHFRWVNNNDIVTRVPPPWLGYRHCGTEIYLNRYGKREELKGWKRVSDRIQGFVGGLMKFRIDQLSDHSVTNYIDSIFKLARQEKAVPSPTSSKSASQPVAETSNEATADSGSGTIASSLAKSSDLPAGQDASDPGSSNSSQKASA